MQVDLGGKGLQAAEPNHQITTVVLWDNYTFNTFTLLFYFILNVCSALFRYAQICCDFWSVRRSYEVKL